MTDIPTIQQCEKAVGLPVAQWEGRCFAIASALVKSGLVKGRAVYGHWTGPVNPRGFWSKKAGMEFIQHGWIVLDEGTGAVLDPTRWSFEGVEPYVYVGEPEDNEYLCHCEHVEDEHERGFLNPCTIPGCPCIDFEKAAATWPYDEGGNALRLSMLLPCPAAGEPVLFTLSADVFALLRLRLPEHAQALVPDVGKNQAFWLANLPLQVLGDKAAEVYNLLEACGLRAAVPFDNLQKVRSGG